MAAATTTAKPKKQQRTTNTSTSTSSLTSSNFRVIRACIPVHLPPSRLAHVQFGVREQLNQYLLRYVEELGGVVMLYRNVELPITRLGVVFQNRSQIHFKVKVEFLIFAPIVNTNIVGRVTTVAHDHIFLLVHQCWNITIPRAEMPDYWRYDRTSERYIDDRTATKSFTPKNIAVDSTVRCRISRLENVGGHFRMAGSLRGSNVAVLEDTVPPALERSLSNNSGISSIGMGGMGMGIKRKRANNDSNGNGAAIITDTSKWAAQLGNELEETNDNDDDDDSNNTSIINDDHDTPKALPSRIEKKVPTSASVPSSSSVAVDTSSAIAPKKTKSTTPPTPSSSVSSTKVKKVKLSNKVKHEASSSLALTA